jgi:hypothetical protein
MMVEKKTMLNCNYCNEKGEVEITEEVIKKLEEGKRNKLMNMKDKGPN